MFLLLFWISAKFGPEKDRKQYNFLMSSYN
jgi:hypothetical protein